MVEEYEKKRPLKKEDGGGWYRVSKGSRESVDKIVKASKEHGPFDGVLGFS